MMHSPSNIGGNTHDKPIGEMSAFPNLFGSIGNTNEDNTAVAIARILGLLVGLASYHNVLTDVPFPPSIYKIMASADPDVSCSGIDTTVSPF